MQHQKGVTLVELVGVLALLGVGLGTAALLGAGPKFPLGDATEDVATLLHGARLQSMAGAEAYRVVAADSDSLIAQRASRCDDASWTDVPGLAVDLASGVNASLTGTLCFGPRGMASDNGRVRLTDGNGSTQDIEVLLAGTLRMSP